MQKNLFSLASLTPRLIRNKNILYGVSALFLMTTAFKTTQAQTIPDQLAGTEPFVFSGTYVPCDALDAMDPTINCDMYELEATDDGGGRLKAIVWDDKDRALGYFTSPTLFVENSLGVNTTVSLPMGGYDPDVIILDNLNNPGVDYYIAVAYRDLTDVFVVVYDVLNANGGMTVNLNNMYNVASGTNSAPHLDGWPDPNVMINGQPSLHEFALVHTDNNDQILLYSTDISLPTFTPWATGQVGAVPDIAAQTEIFTGDQYGFTTYTDVPTPGNPATTVKLMESNFTTHFTGPGVPYQTAWGVFLPRIEALGLFDINSGSDRIRWQIANIAGITSSGWQIYGHNNANPSFSVTPVVHDFFSPAVASGLGTLGPTPGNLCNQNFVINYFKAADNVYSTNVSMLSGAWSGSSYQVNINPIDHPVTFPKFVAVSSCSNSGLNLLSAWYDGSGDCVTPGNGTYTIKKAPAIPCRLRRQV